MTSNRVRRMASLFGLEDFSIFYSSAPSDSSGCIIMSNSIPKIFWDVWILILLILVCLVVPWRLAFYDENSFNWMIAYFSIDFFFLLDIILTFFTSVSDDQNIGEIVNKKQIAIIYLKSWFWVDLISIFPLDMINLLS